MMRTVLSLLFILTSAQLSFAAGGGGSSSYSSSSSGSDTSGTSSYSNSGSGNQQKDPFAKAYQFINNENFDDAFKELQTVTAPGKKADLYNLLGFTARKSGKLDVASEYYERALTINAKHVGALQYQGELFITLGDIENAKQNLEKIKSACWLFSCKEEKLLQVAIEEAVGS